MQLIQHFKFKLGNYRSIFFYVLWVFIVGDKAFVEFLSDEIKEEKKIQKHKSLPKMSGGWELEVNGTEAKLVRKVAGEK